MALGILEMSNIPSTVRCWARYLLTRCKWADRSIHHSRPSMEARQQRLHMVITRHCQPHVHVQDVLPPWTIPSSLPSRSLAIVPCRIYMHHFEGSCALTDGSSCQGLSQSQCVQCVQCLLSNTGFRGRKTMEFARLGASPGLLETETATERNRSTNQDGMAASSVFIDIGAL